MLSTQYDMRDYQQAAKDAVLRDWKQGIRSTMVVLPTGTGKTVVSSSVAETLWEWHHTREIDYSGAILFLAPREELILQTRDKFVRQIPDARIAVEMGDEYKAHRQLFRKPEIVLATTASMLSRYKHYPKDYFSAAFLDECHHSTGKSYTEPLAFFEDSIQYILGMTATPKRHDGKAMGRVFDHCSYSMLLPEAVDLGWICEPRVERVPVRELRLQDINNVAGDFAQGALSRELCREPVLQSMVATTIALSTGRQTAIYCVDIAHMQAVERELARQGQRCVLIDGKTPKLIRRSRLKQFANYDVQYIVSCGTLTTGWDCPACEVIAMFRPTQSLTLYEQIVGRALRPLDPPTQETPEARRLAIAQSAKPFALILDFVGNSRHKLANIGDILGGSFDEEVRRLAMDLAKHESGPIDMTAMLKKAEAALEAKRAAQYDRSTIEAKLKDAIWRLNPHPFEVLGLSRERAEEAVTKDEAYGASLDRGRSTLEEYQLRPHECQRLTNKETVYLARVLVARTGRRQASYAQARLLWRLGYSTNVPIGAASAILDRCRDEGWIRPKEEGWNVRYDDVRTRDEFAYMWKAIDQLRERFDGQRDLPLEG